MARQPETGDRTIYTEVAKLKGVVADLARRSPFYNTGMKPDGKGGVQSNDFDGDLEAGNAGTKGWAMNGLRAAFGELLLRPGSIGNDSLTSPVDGRVGNVSRTNFALPSGTLAEITGQNITVPAGFTQCLVTAGATVFAYNPNTTGGSNGTGGDAIYCMVAVDTSFSHANPVGVSGSGGFATSFSAAGFELTGLTPGQVIRLGVYGSAAYQNIAANVDNYANAYASMIWLR